VRKKLFARGREKGDKGREKGEREGREKGERNFSFSGAN
jgi:hypothetical protein